MTPGQVLTVTDIDATVAFYTRVLRMEEVILPGGRRALTLGGTTVELRRAGDDPAPDGRAAPGADGGAMAGDTELRLAVVGPVELMVSGLTLHGVAVEAGPVTRPGAAGPVTCVRFRDPDGHLVELCVSEPDFRICGLAARAIADL